MGMFFAYVTSIGIVVMYREGVQANHLFAVSMAMGLCVLMFWLIGRVLVL